MRKHQGNASGKTPWRALDSAAFREDLKETRTGVADAGTSPKSALNACDDARCTRAGGESPSLPGLVLKGEIELAGSDALSGPR